jgi:hypothetical protein
MASPPDGSSKPLPPQHSSSEGPSSGRSSRLYSIESDAETGIIRFRWRTQPTGEEVRYGANRLLERLRSKGASGLIVDIRGLTAHRPSDMKWLEERWLPKARDTGIRCVAVVHEGDLIGRTQMNALESRVQEKEGSGTFPALRATESLQAARAWIRDQTRETRSLLAALRRLFSQEVFFRG